MSKIPVGKRETIEIQKKIEDYILGRLSDTEEDDLRVEFLKEPA